MLTPTETINPYEAIAAQAKHDHKVKRRRIAQERLRKQLLTSVTYDDTPSYETLKLKTQEHYAFPTVDPNDERVKEAIRRGVIRTPNSKKRKVVRPTMPAISPNRVDELRETIRRAKRVIRRAEEELVAIAYQEQEETEVESGEETEEEIVLI